MPDTATTTLGSTEPVGKLVGDFLETNINEITIRRTGDGVFYLKPDDVGVIGIRAASDGSSPVSVFSSPLSEWLANWPAETTVVLTTKPSSLVAGNVFFLDTNSGSLSHAFGGVLGLVTTPSPDLKTFLYSSKSDLRLLNTDTNEILALDLKTIADKCVWQNDSKYVFCGANPSAQTDNLPDAWYQGLVSFDDSLWKINPQTQETEIVVSPDDFGVSLDITNPQISDDGSHVIFIDKNTLSLWLVRLPAVVEF